MDRLFILNALATKIKANSYLEIGVFQGYTLENNTCPHKVGVDPDPHSKATVFTTSDEFFATNNETFDLVFIDGLHHSDQVQLDIENSLSVLNDGGYIVCHDMLPATEQCQIVPRQQEYWTGDCWKAWVNLRKQRNDLEMFVIDTDHGCGIIRPGVQETISVDCELTWDNFLKHRGDWMNIISLRQFLSYLEAK